MQQPHPHQNLLLPPPPPQPSDFQPIGTMDSIGFRPRTGKLPRKELQGPRPPPLSVRKDSHKVRKPPLVASIAAQQLPPQQPPRQPVIIYAVSPKVIHTDPGEFMALVQRLTGPSPKFAAARADPFQHPGWPVSPAARFAAVEMAVKSPAGKRQRKDSVDFDDDVAILEGVFDVSGRAVERTGAGLGILSPGPTSLQPIPATFFSPVSGPSPNPLSFLPDFSPGVLFSNKSFNFSDQINDFLHSPTLAFVSPGCTVMATTPLASMDLFNNFFDL